MVTTGSIYMTLDSAANALLGGIFWIVVGKLAPDDVVGWAAQIVALTSVLVVFAGLGFNFGASKFISEYNSKGQRSLSRLVYSKTIKITLTSSLALALGLALLSAYVASGIYDDPQLTLLVVLGAVSLPFQALVRSLNGVYQGCHRMAYCFLGDMTFLSLRLVIAVLLVLGGFGAVGIVLGYVLGFITSALVGVTVLAPSALPKERKAEYPELSRKMFQFSTANYLATIFNTAANQVSIPLVGFFLGPSPAAHYNIAFLTRIVLVTTASSIGLALLPTVSSILSSEDRKSISILYNSSIRSAILLVSAPILVFFLVPNQVLELIRSEYTAASTALQILAISSLGSIVLATTTAVLNGMNRPFNALLATGIGAVVSIGLSAAMIPMWGISGAAVGVLVGGLAGAAISVSMLSLRESIPTQLSSVLKPSLALTSAIVVGELLIRIGIQAYFSVAVSLVALLGVAVVIGGLTPSELTSVIKLAIQKVKPQSLLGAAK